MMAVDKNQGFERWSERTEVPTSFGDDPPLQYNHF